MHKKQMDNPYPNIEEDYETSENSETSDDSGLEVLDRFLRGVGRVQNKLQTGYETHLQGRWFEFIVLFIVLGAVVYLFFVMGSTERRGHC